MPFPISLSGSIEVPGVSAPDALARIEDALGGERASSVDRDGDLISFRGGIFRVVSSWNQLVLFSTGAIHVSPSAEGVRLAYHASLIQPLVAVTLMVGALVAPPIIAAPNLSLPEALGVLLLAWTWLFGGNVVIARWRFPRFLARAVSPSAR